MRLGSIIVHVANHGRDDAGGDDSGHAMTWGRLWPADGDSGAPCLGVCLGP